MKSRLYKKLFSAARKARSNSYSPYSKFRVGAALLTAKGKIFTGTNVENASFGLTVCAERIAIYRALCEGEKKFKAILIVSDRKNITVPCGACLGVIREFGDDIDVIMCGISGKHEIKKISELMPMVFRK